MGLVFLAEDSLLGRPVALKVIRPQIADTPGIAQRFTREARATAAIKHDHIVTIYQVGQERDVPFLAMEYLKGISLANWLDRGHSASVEVVLRISREIAGGLSAAHKNGLIHRDVKPANIWLEAPFGRVKILDFGMARSQREDVEITRSGTVMGTPAYMSPEQARGELAGAGSDLFSLGCVMYRLCTGRLPFEGESVIAVLTALSTNVPRRPRDWHSELPPALDELVMRLLAKDPADRPESAEVVCKEIRTIEQELHAKRHKSELRATADVTDAARPSNEAPREFAAQTTSTQAAPAPRSRRRALGITAAVLAVLAATAVAHFFFGPARESKVRMVANAPESAVAHFQGAIAPIVPLKAEAERTAQGPASAPVLGSRADRGAVPEASALARLDTPRSIPATEPGPPQAQEVLQRDAQPFNRPAAIVRSTGNHRSTASIADDGPMPEGRAPTAPQVEAWGDAVDPDGDCKFELDPREDKVRIIVPGKPHLLSPKLVA